MTQSFTPPARPIIGEEERAAVDRVLRSGMVAQGPEAAAPETEFSGHFKLGRTCVAISSGTSGLHLGLLPCGIGAGDEVIVPSFTFTVTASSVAPAGTTPVFADISAGGFIPDPAFVKAFITEYTKAIIPVHLYGHPAQMDKLRITADSYSLLLFEDAAQAHSASLDGAPVRAFGEFAMFSLYPAKNMTSGEGGMVSYAGAIIERNTHLYRNQGMLQQYHNEVVDLNSRMTGIHAAIGRVWLTKVDAWTRTCQENAVLLSVNLEGVAPPPVADGAVHMYYQYTIRVFEGCDGLVKALKEEYQVGSEMFYLVPNHRLKPFQSSVKLPETECAAEECLSPPVHLSLTWKDLERIVNAVNTPAKAGA